LTGYAEWSKDFDQKFNSLKSKITKLMESSNKDSISLNDNYNNFNKRDSKQITSNKQIKSKVTNLDREMSYSDSNIDYQANYEDVEEASGSAGLINLDGSLNLNMILKGCHSVILKENSIKLCDLTLNILENLMNIDILPNEEIDEKLKKARNNTSLSQSSCAYLDDLESKYNENFHLASDLVLRYIFIF
jgi:hypothetical protein